MLKITGLTPLNVRALREVFPTAVESGDIVLTQTTATFSADDAADTISFAIARLRPTTGHPRASLYAVLRKLKQTTPTQ